MALTGEISTPKGALGDFSRESMPTDEYHLPHIKSISLIDKVRVVNALVGFSRITPVVNSDDSGFVSVKKTVQDGTLHIKCVEKEFLSN